MVDAHPEHHPASGGSRPSSSSNADALRISATPSLDRAVGVNASIDGIDWIWSSRLLSATRSRQSTSFPARNTRMRNATRSSVDSQTMVTNSTSDGPIQVRPASQIRRHSARPAGPAGAADPAARPPAPAAPRSVAGCVDPVARSRACAGPPAARAGSARDESPSFHAETVDLARSGEVPRTDERKLLIRRAAHKRGRGSRTATG